MFWQLALMPLGVAAYDPMALPAGDLPDDAALTIRDEKRSRDIPVRIQLPASAGAAPVVIFSHGLGGSRDNSRYLSDHFAARGYACIWVQHPGSDEAVWKDVPMLQRRAAMNRAASGQNFQLRVQDVPAVLDQLERWNEEGRFKGRFDIARIGMSGHSFGARTTQAVSGESFGPAGQTYTDPRIDAAIAYSPSMRANGGAGDFAQVKIPWMLQTGTKDTAPIGPGSLEDRFKVYPALPKTIDRFQLVLWEAEHSAFTDRSLPGESGKRNPNHHRVILATSTAFWDAYLMGSAEAKAWLQGPEARSVMEDKDDWKAEKAQGL